MDVVINGCYGGFGLSHDAIMAYAERKGITLYADGQGESTHYYTVPVAIYKGADRPEDGWYFSSHDVARDDTDLVAVVQALGESASGTYAQLRVVEIPDGIDYTIDEYDGIEHIAERHRTWS